MKNKNFWILAILTCGALAVIAVSIYLISHKNIEQETIPAPVKTSPTSIEDFKGAWFAISYPADFEVHPIYPSEKPSSVTEPDEVLFSSPDGAVDFFVYSPQWGGAPVWYLEQQPNEVKESDESKKEIKPVNSTVTDFRITRWITYKAKDASYTRAVVLIEDGFDDTVSTNHVFGIRFKDQDAYNKYLSQYVAFKKSLIQYAD